MAKINKGARRRIFLLFSILTVLVSYVSYNTFLYWKQILKNKRDTIKYQEKYRQLLKEEEVLETDVIKLQDPEYVAKYAREKYLYTKDGELIIKIIEENE